MEHATIPNTGSNSRSSHVSCDGRDPAHGSTRNLHVQPVPLSTEALALLQASKAETGFDSYCAYLDFHAPADPGLRRLSSALKGWPHRTYPEAKWIGSVLNVSKSRSSLVNQIHQVDDFGTEIIEALCCPPETACLQIVLWNISSINDLRSHRNLVDFLGLRYRLDPLIFNSILYVFKSSSTGAPKRSRLDRYKPTHMRVGSAIATFCLSPDQNDSLPVVLIVGPFDDSAFGRQQKDSADQFGPCPPFSRAPIPNTIHEAIPSQGIYRYYPRLLLSSLEQYHDVHGNDIYLPLTCVLPLLHLNLFLLRYLSLSLREAFDRANPTIYDGVQEEERWHTDVSFCRTRLRLGIVDAEDDWCGFVKYMSAHLPHGFLEKAFRSGL